ncbi:MAG: hypothetical protein AB1410_09530 [Acidobacteriota bacterium]
MTNEERHYTFIFKYGGYIVYLVFLIGLFLNGGVAILYFKNGQWLFGIWALSSIILLPKVTLGLILILGRKSIVFMNMPMIIWKIFPGTMQKYRSDSLISIFGNPVLKGFIKQIIWLVISLVPIIAFICQS